MSDIPDDICTACQRRIRLASALRSQGIVAIPASAVDKNAPLTLRLLALLQDAGAVTSWVRPDVYRLARQAGATQSGVHAALKRLVTMGWLEKRRLNTRAPNSPSDYRVPLN